MAGCELVKGGMKALIISGVLLAAAVANGQKAGGGGTVSIPTPPAPPPANGFERGRPLADSANQQSGQTTVPGGTAAITNGVSGDANAVQNSADSTRLPTGAQPPPTNQPPTNNVAMTNRTDFQQDQAITEADRELLTQIRQAVFAGQTPGQAGALPVHFILKDGVVRLVGTVPTIQERQRIESLVQRVPGVIRIYDAMTVPAQQVSVNVVNGLAPTAAGQNIAPAQPALLSATNSGLSAPGPGGALPPTGTNTGTVYPKP